MAISTQRAPVMLMLTQYYPPEPGAASVRLQAMARELVRNGWRVKVVTAFPHHLGYRDHQYRMKVAVKEQDGPIPVVRTWVWVVPTGRIWRRLLNYFSFVATSLVGLSRMGPADYLLVESPPLFLGLSAYLYCRMHRIPYIFSVSDLWPESAVALGFLKNRLAIRLAEALEHFLYRHAYRVSAVTEGIREHVAAVVGADRVLFAPNGVDLNKFPAVPPDRALARELGIEGKKVFLYPGTLGYAQGLEVIVGAAQELRSETDIVFLLVGDGPVKKDLEQKVAAMNLSNVVFEDLQPVERMPLYLALACAVVVPLRRHRLFSGARPSKVFPAWSAGVPVIFSGEGEMASVMEASHAGMTVPPGDVLALAEAVLTMAKMSTQEVQEMGQRGRAFVAEHYTWPKIMDHWLDGLDVR